MDKVYFFYENGDLQAYPSLRALVCDVEQIDVDNGAFEFWDSELTEFTLDTRGWPDRLRDISEDLLIEPVRELGREKIMAIMADYCRDLDLAAEIHDPRAMADAILRFQRP